MSVNVIILSKSSSERLAWSRVTMRNIAKKRWRKGYLFIVGGAVVQCPQLRQNLFYHNAADSVDLGKKLWVRPVEGII